MKNLLLLGGTDDDNGDYSLLQQAAKSAAQTVPNWSTLKEARLGDQVWFYIPAPHSAIVASGIALADAEPGSDWPYTMPVGELKWLARPIELQELRDKFPEWTWTQRARARTYLPDDVAEYLRAPPPARTQYVAYHSAAVMGRPYTRNSTGPVSFVTSKPEKTVRRMLGHTVWVISGERSGRRTEYHIEGNFEPTELARSGEVWTISGPGNSLPAPLLVTDEPWFLELLNEQANFSLGLSPIRSVTVLAKLASLVQGATISDPPGLPEEVSEAEYREGNGIQVVVNRYERDAAARTACLQHFGTVCRICEVDLATIYGPAAAGLIHVHHLHPLANLGAEHEVRPETDLIPVCPNCHAVVHYRQDPPRTPAEVREMIARASAD
ncbi:MAG: hypothetical protein WDO74_04975 [Pseudomonadota bacterium]